MNHWLSEEKWSDYLDGAVSEAERLSIQLHLHSCAGCRETVDLMRAVDAVMISAGASLRESVPVSASDVSSAKEKALGRLGDSDVPLRVSSLFFLLAPMCGVETSTRAIRTAVCRVSTESPRLLEERLWPGFVQHLHAIVATLCGDPAAQLILERGMRLQQEAA